MRKLQDRLNEIERKNTQKKWSGLEEADGLSTREKLEKLVQQNLKRKGLAPVKTRAQAPCRRQGAIPGQGFLLLP